MQEDRPQVDFPDTIHGHGVLLTDRGERLVDATIALHRARYAYTTPWQLTGHVSKDGHKRLNLHERGITFDGNDDSGAPLRVEQMELHWSNFPQNGQARARVYGHASEVRFGDDSFPVMPENHFVVAYLTETDFALSEADPLQPSWTGEIIKSERPTPPLEWDCVFGRAKLWRSHRYENARAGDAKAIVQVGRPGIEVEGPARNAQGSLRDHLDTLEAELNDLCAVLSFIGRTRVDWTEIKVTSNIRDDPSDERIGYGEDVRRLRTARASNGAQGLDSLVNRWRCQPATLNELCINYRNLPFKESAFLAISYLLQTFQPGYLEEHVADAFTALETLVAGMAEAEGKGLTLQESEFIGLKTVLKASIKDYGKKQGLNPQQRAAIYAKLSELNRPSIVQGIGDAIQRFSVSWADLWPKNTVCSTALRDAYDRRSTLVHTGKLVNAQESYEDLGRMQALTERLLYRLLNGDEAVVPPHAFRHAVHRSSETGQT